MKVFNISHLLLLLIFVAGINRSMAQIENYLTDASFDPDSISIGETSNLTINFVNNGSSEIASESIEITISTPSSSYTSDGMTPPSGDGASLFVWTYEGADSWSGVNANSIPVEAGGEIVLTVSGTQESEGYEITEVSIDYLFGTLIETLPALLEPSLLVTLPCPGPLDADGDGLTDCEEMTAIDDLSTTAIPTMTSDELDPCDPDPLAIPTGDCDKDGNPNSTDPNPLMALAVDDTTSGIVDTMLTFNVLANDDFLPGMNISLDTTANSTATGSITTDSLTGTIKYTPVEAEEGDTVTIEYVVCNLLESPVVCDTGVLRIAVLPRYDITGTFFADDNGNGQFDGAEMGIGSAVVNLYDDGGVLVTSVISNPDGTYLIMNVTVGSYSIGFELTPDYNTFTQDSLGPLPTASLVDANGETDIFTLVDADLEDVNAGAVNCDGMACNGKMNISISENCEAILTPSMLLKNIQFVDSAYILTIIDSDGNIKTDSLFTKDDIGMTFDVMVEDLVCGNVCWLPILIEYKYDPVIICVPNDTLSCTQAFDEASKPSVETNCANVELTLIAESIDPFSCDTLFTASMTRSYVAIDEFGNISDTCTQTIFLERTNLDSITGPENFIAPLNSAISCSSGYATTPEGYPAPSYTGVPVLKINDTTFVDLYPFDASVICNGYVDFEDELLFGSTSCVTKIKRTWEVGEWHCTNPEPWIYVQLIEVADFEGPSVNCPADMTISTSDFDCEATTSFALPSFTDLCSNSSFKIDLSTPVGFFPNYNGQSIMLPVGTHTLKYSVYDACNNLTDCEFDITVVDNADPIAICDQTTTVGISLDTITQVTAEMIDDGSFDECGPVTIAIARMDAPGFADLTGFGPTVPVYCDDIGKDVMVGLLVTDMGGNTNMCMVALEVTDKVPALMTCPADMTVECNFPYDPDNLAAFFGGVTIYDNCPESNTVEDEIIVDNVNNCGSGNLVRRLRLRNAAGALLQTCTQNITFLNGNQLQYSDISWPALNMTVTGCGIDALDPDVIGKPSIPDIPCRLIGVSMENDTFPFTTNGACLKIIRKWSVIDWCQSDGPGSVYSPFTYEQTLVVNNTVSPTFDVVPVDSTICSFAFDCGGINVTYLTAEASDDCTVSSDILRRYEVRNGNGTLVKFGNGHNANGKYELGEYEVTYIAEDKCGNVSTAIMNFEVENCKLPTPYCLGALSVTLTAMDTTGDNMADAEMVMLSPSFFDAGSYHPCGYDVTLSFSSDVNDTIATFFCSDTIALQPIELWVTDENGRQAFCTAMLDVQNNDTIDLCGGLKPVDVVGLIFTEKDALVEGVAVEFVGVETLLDYTSTSGEYGFYDMPTGGEYKVVPAMDYDILNGVSTLDLVLIQRHILGIALLDSPYKLIAADINNNEKISASDLSGLRKVILGIDESFPNNTSWKFIDEAFVFPDASNPWASPIPLDYNIAELVADMKIDFVGVKVGDVNGNVSANVNAGITSEVRSYNSMIFSLPDLEIQNGNTYTIDVLAEEDVHLFGFQNTWEIGGLNSSQVIPGLLNVDNSMIAKHNDRLHMSFGEPNGIQVRKGDKLFSLVVNMDIEGKLSDLISLSNKGLSAEAYIGEGLSTGNVDISWRSASVEVNKDGQFAILSNSPNPWKHSTEIAFVIPSDGNVVLTIFDNNGRLLNTQKADFKAGKNYFIVDRSDVNASGLLLYNIKYGESVVHNKMIVIE